MLTNSSKLIYTFPVVEMSAHDTRSFVQTKIELTLHIFCYLRKCRCVLSWLYTIYKRIKLAAFVV